MQEVAIVANLIATISVVVGLGALFFQVRATRKQVELQNFTEYTRRYQDIVLNLPESINSSDFDFRKQNDELREKSLRYLRAYYDLCSEEYYLSQKGFVDCEVWTLWKDGMRSAFTKRAFMDAWEVIQKDSYFSDEFASFVEHIQVKAK